MKGIYITGTDTGIGKTFASVALLHALRARGLRAVGMKPVASGCEQHDGQWRNDDALALQAASEPRPPYADINPYALPQATAPEIAARDAGIEIGLPRIEAAYRNLQMHADIVVVEGVGGWAAPLSSMLDQSDMVRALDLRVVMVVGMRLGCINHARLTARAVADDGAVISGWIGNDIESDMTHHDAYFQLVRSRIAAPCLGRLPRLPAGQPIGALAAHATLDALLT